MQEKDKLQALHGNILTFKLPSGDTITIREQNGEDDEVLSNMQSIELGTSYDEFLQGIILSHSRYDGNKPTIEQVSLMPQRDRVVTTVMSRILSLGKELAFNFKWSSNDKDDNGDRYVDDLEDYIWDYSKPFPRVGDEDYKSTRIPPYEYNPYDSVVVETESGKKLRFTPSNGKSEIYLSGLGKQEQSKNSELKSRSLELFLKDSGEWVTVQNFKSLTARDMMDIRTMVEKFDKTYALLSVIENPYDSNQVQYVDLLTLVDFFYPMVNL